MSNSKLYEAIRTYNSSVKELGLSAEILERSMLDVCHRTINSDAFREHFENKDAEDYTEFDKAVLEFYAEVLSYIDNSKAADAYSKSVKDYSEVLKLLAKG
ncbi:TPA: hypothetical protein NGS39_004516 [Vibrio parahaemolyticus]|nr:hypothetical protein [Vibrio parahaemolyticus]